MSIIDSIQYLKALKSLEQGRNLYKKAGYMYKAAAQPPAGPPPGGDPGAGGPPPGDPSMGGGMPPGGDPSMGGMPPGGDPSMGGMPPGGDPSMMGGAPPMDPSMMGGMPPMGMPPMDPSMMGGMPPQSPQETEQKVTNKVKTEQWMQHIDSYNYNLLKLMINLYEHMGIPVPAESLLPQPLGQSAPSAGDISGMMGAAATATSPQSPIDAMVNGDAAPPNAGGGAPPMDPGMMDPSMMGPPPGGDMGAGGPPPMEGGDVKQSSWNGYNRYYNTSWSAPYHRQAGVSPAPQRTKQASYFNYPQQYRDVMNKFNQLRGFDRGW